MSLILPATSCDNTCEMFQPGKILRLRTQSIHWGLVTWARRLSTKDQHSRLAEVFSINDIICTNSLCTLNHFYQLVLGILLKSKFPDTSQGSTLQADLFKNSNLGYVNSFLHTTNNGKENTWQRHFTITSWLEDDWK